MRKMFAILASASLIALSAGCVTVNPSACGWAEVHDFENPEALTDLELIREATHNDLVEELCR